MLDMSTFGDMMSETEISLSGNNVADRLAVAKTSIVVNKDNGSETCQCPPFFDGLLCWSRTNAPGTVTLPCPPASIIGYADFASDNLRALAVASKVCLANGEWYKNSDGVSWSNYSLCMLNSTPYIVEKNYSRWYGTPAEFALLNVSFILVTWHRLLRSGIRLITEFNN